MDGRAAEMVDCVGADAACHDGCPTVSAAAAEPAVSAVGQRFAGRVGLVTAGVLFLMAIAWAIYVALQPVTSAGGCANDQYNHLTCSTPSSTPAN